MSTHALFQIPAGRAADRVGAKRVMLAGLACLCVANAAALAAPSVPLVVCLRTLAGVGTAAGFVGGSEYVRAMSGSSVAQGVFGGVATGSGGAAITVVPLLAHRIGWRAPFASALAVALVAAAVAAAAPRDARHRAARAPGRLLADRRLVRFAIVHSASFGLSVVAGNWIVTLLVRAGGYGDAFAGLVGGLILATAIVSRPVGGWLRARGAATADRAVALSLVAAALSTLVFLHPRPAGVTAAAALVFGFAVGIPFAPVFDGAARTRPDAPAAAIGLVNTAAALTIVAGTPLLGLGFSLPGQGRIGFAVLAALLLVAAVFAPRSQRSPAPLESST